MSAKKTPEEFLDYDLEPSHHKSKKKIKCRFSRKDRRKVKIDINLAVNHPYAKGTEEDPGV